MNYVWLICLCITHAAMYYMGRKDGEEIMPDDDAWITAEKYDIDKYYEYMRWLEERKNHHDAG